MVAEAYPGTYKVNVDRVWGHPLGDKVQLRIVRHKGTPAEREELVTVDLKSDKPILVSLEGGRRTQMADVPPPAAAERLASSTAPPTSADAISQLQRLADPTGYAGTESSFGADGLGVVAEGKIPEPSPRDELAYQTRVAPFATNSIDATVQAVISADRRYVRFSLAPSFNVVTGTHLQSALIRNPIIPGFPTP